MHSSARAFPRLLLPLFFAPPAAADLSAAPAAPPAPCRIDVVESGSGWPVPLVELRTTHGVRFVSDNAGAIAFDLPELMGEETWFTVVGHGYTVPKDGFGYRGVRLTPTPGGRLEVTVDRALPAKRLGRITGAGIFGESQQLGAELGWREQGILGCDSVQNTVHDGKLFWAWGDTTIARYPLGIFHMLGATTDVRPLRSFRPPVRLSYGYFKDAAGLPREIARLPGEGPTWLSGLVSLPSAAGGRHRLVAHYVKIEPPLTVYQSGLCVWDEGEKRFRRHRVLWERGSGPAERPPTPEGHTTFWTDPAGERWLLFGDPFPRLRCAPTFEAWEDPGTWEVLTPQEKVTPVGGGPPVTPHRGSIAWNAHRQKWVTIFTQIGGAPSFLGELWYAEAPRPEGPWGPAVKVVSHGNYSCYNPRLHPGFTPQNTDGSPPSPILLFEGTFTQQFADRPPATPRHDYNQVLYRLDLDDPALLRQLEKPPPGSGDR